MKNILVTKKFYDCDLEYISKKCIGINFVDPIYYEPSHILDFINSFEDTIHGLMGPIIIDHDSLEIIQIPWSGVDNIVFTLSNTKIPICCSKSNSNAVAEHAISLYLSMVKRIPFHDNLMRSGEWARPGSSLFNPSLMFCDQRIGLLGYGSISKLIENKINNLVHSVSICNRTSLDSSNYFSLDNIETFFKSVDVVFICLPSNEDTIKLINGVDNYLFDNKFVINISRKDLFSEDKLINLLNSFNNFYYASDVWESHSINDDGIYPFSEEKYLKNKNIIFSPHRAAFIKNKLPHLDDVIINFQKLVNNKKDYINRINL